MRCPYCSSQDDVRLVGIPTAALLVRLAPSLGLGVLSIMAATALVATYRITGKRIYKCEVCNKYFVA